MSGLENIESEGDFPLNMFESVILLVILCSLLGVTIAVMRELSSPQPEPPLPVSTREIKNEIGFYGQELEKNLVKEQQEAYEKRLEKLEKMLDNRR